MPTFVLMTKLAPGGVSSAQARQAMGREWLAKVKAACPEVKFVAHYAILGPYDYMDIYEAPNVETAHKVSIVTRSEGAVSAESWQALQYDAFLEVLAQVKP